ncbi:hypothetical protein ACLQ3C_14760 [Gordonia sp. DT30]|uniref:hypothetical protein n=1 Tax=unclassified Gordonia (in: high G+C Gram-positive bacteria) TaxID=2657482 RepID=UPI003CF02436
MGSSQSGSEASGGRVPHDLNGRPVPPSRRQRLAARLGGRRAPSAIGVDDADLQVVVACTDDAASSSAVLAGSPWRSDDQAVVRHLVALPGERVDEAVALAALDGYRPVSPTAALPAPEIAIPDGHVSVLLARVQLVDALHLSQERSRMAGLGARHGGVALAWQVLQRAVATQEP